MAEDGASRPGQPIRFLGMGHAQAHQRLAGSGHTRDQNQPASPRGCRFPDDVVDAVNGCVRIGQGTPQPRYPATVKQSPGRLNQAR